MNAREKNLIALMLSYYENEDEMGTMEMVEYNAKIVGKLLASGYLNKEAFIPFSGDDKLTYYYNTSLYPLTLSGTASYTESRYDEIRNKTVFKVMRDIGAVIALAATIVFGILQAL